MRLLLLLLLVATPLLCAVSVVAKFNSSGQCNVKTYGAVGDGFHDDTAAVQKAVQACLALSQSTSVLFPAGIYKLVSTNTLPVLDVPCWMFSNASVSFVGDTSGGSEGAMLMWDASTAQGGSRLFDVTQCSNVLFTNLWVQVSANASDPRDVTVLSVSESNGIEIANFAVTLDSKSSTPFGSAFSFMSVQTIVVHHVHLEGSSDTAIYFGNSSDVFISQAELHGHVVDEYNTLIDVQDSSTDIRIDNVLFTDTMRGITFESRDSPSYVATITHCAFENCGYAGIYVLDNVTVALTNSVFNQSVSSTASNAHHGIVIEGRVGQTTQSVNVGGCMFQNLTGWGITGYPGTTGSLRVEGSGFTYCASGGVMLWADQGSTTQHTQLTIDESFFAFNQQANLNLEGDRWELTDNTCVGNTPSTLVCRNQDCLSINNNGCNF
jgi:hypothetical protein